MNYHSFAFLNFALFFAWAGMFPGFCRAETRVTLLHTNDLHSHFRPDHSPRSIGGLARIKTLADSIRASTPHVLMVDGGDWSEGSIYYTEGAGAQSLRLMEKVGYDVAVVGNHDWLNGPDILLRAIQEANPKFSLIGANLDTDSYSHSKEFRSKVFPFVIKEVGGVRIAFVGLLTYNFIFDSYFAPIKLSEPFSAAVNLARELKKNADLVIGVSHNITDTNLKILKAATDMDGIIGAHDHRQFNQPLWVDRPGRSRAWVVEAGFHGKYLGQLDLRISPGVGSQVESYRLIQVDHTVPENGMINREIDLLESWIERRMGPVFHDHLGESEVETSHYGIQSSVGAIVTDAFRAAVPFADAALDHPKFIYKDLFVGPIRSADAFDLKAAVFNPQTGKTWNIQLLSVRGKTLAWLMNLAGEFPAIFNAGWFVSVSGIQANWNGSANGLSLKGSPLPGRPSSSWMSALWVLTQGFITQAQAPFEDLLINGQPVEPYRVYRLAVSYGLVESIRFVNSLIPNFIPVEDVQDTGIEAWRALADYVRKTQRITRGSLALESRLRTHPVDLGLDTNDIRWKNPIQQGSDMVADLEITVHNYGLSPSGAQAASVSLFTNRYGADDSIDPDYLALGSVKLPSMTPGAIQKVLFKGVRLKEDRGVFPVRVEVIPATGTELNSSNQQAIHFFRRDER